MNTTTLNPTPIHEHVAALGAVPVEALNAELEARIRARHGAPTGFHLELTLNDIQELLADPDYSGEWYGPSIQLQNSKITTGWNSTNGITFFVDHEADNPWPISQAEALSAAIQALATRLDPKCGVTMKAAGGGTSELATGPIHCESWCDDGTGHADETLADDQTCWTSGMSVTLSTHNANRPASEPDCIELFMHRAEEHGELVIGFDSSTVARIDPEFTKAEWDQFVRSGNEMWEASNG